MLPQFLAADARGYWDEGRMSPHGHLADLLALRDAFSAVFLAALKVLKTMPPDA